LRSAIELLVLGSSGAASPDRGSASFLVGESLAVDAGSLASGISLARQRRIRTVLLTHRHFDHLRELPLFLDNVYAFRGPAVAIGAGPETSSALFRHVLNGVLWPDPRKFRPPPATFFTVRPERELRRHGLRIIPIRLHHTAPSLGYLFRRGRAAAAILGDTGYQEAVFRRLARTAGLQFLAIEVSYPSRMEELADLALHLTADKLEKGLAIVRRAHPRLKVLATHIKPPWAARTEREIARLDPRVLIARDGTRFSFLPG
jgi:ribonuclease BN (tRNA processing enzyme)